MEAAGARLLVVDDEEALRDMLERGLRLAGFVVRSVSHGRDALDQVRKWSPDLLILDVMLPGTDGFSLLPALRQVTDIPILMLSARSDTEEKIMGLSRGADDYIAKPFEFSELVARIRTALRRPRIERPQTLAYADLSVDVTRRTAVRGERLVELSNREFDLLLVLLGEPERVFTRAELLDLVWGLDSEVYPNTVETYISYLRAKIDSGERMKLIKTQRGLGYSIQRTD